MGRTTSRTRRWQIATSLLLAAGNVAAAEQAEEASGVVTGGVWRYAQRWAARHDADGDGRLAVAEWPSPGPSPAEVDADGDGVLSVEELAQYIAQYGSHRKIRLMPATFGGGVPLPSLLRPGEFEAGEVGEAGSLETAELADEPAADESSAAQEGPEAAEVPPSDRKYFVLPSRLPAGLPDWFRKGDRDGDGQLTLAEYAEVGSASADKEFARYDRNRDGLVTPGEVLGRPVTPKPPGRVPSLPIGATPAADHESEPPQAVSGESPATDSGQPASEAPETSKTDRNERDGERGSRRNQRSLERSE